METDHKFEDPFITARNEERAYVDMVELRTLWFNTGSLCNLACENCYIESSPSNDRLCFIMAADVEKYLNEVRDLVLPVKQIGFTGGEPFANPHMIAILEETLRRGYDVLLLTNAYKAIKKFFPQLIALKDKYTEALKIRVSLDHYTQEVHEHERGKNTFEETLGNLKFLVENGFHVSVAGRSLLKEPQPDALKGYQHLLKLRDINLVLKLGESITIFPEMDQVHNVPEITTACWGILKKSPSDQMCASERMLVKEKGRSDLTVMPCTLLAYDEQFKLGHSLKDSKTRVQLNHPFCAKFCVLGGASCT